MKIQSPIIGVARTSLNRTAQAIERSLARLSSGREVNSPRDNAAAYSMGVNLESQVRGLKQGVLNANQAQSLLMTAESAVTSQLDLVQRMRELAVQASNGTLSTNDRNALNTELQGLLDEFTRIARSTEFNGSKLLDGSTLTREIQIGANRDESIDLRLNDLTSSNVFTKTVGTGAFQFNATFLATGTANERGAKVGDFNNDGHEDVLIIGTSVNDIFLGDGEGGFSLIQTWAAGSASFQAHQIGDINNDGILDIVGFKTNTSIATWLGNGDGTFQISQADFAAGAGFVRLGDFNGDGSSDVFTIDQGSGVAQIALNDGNGIFTAGQTLQLTDMSTAEIADLNGDGIDDLVSVDIDNVISIHHSNGNGGFSFYSTTYNGAGGTNALKIGDFNSDGDLDLASAVSGTGVLLNRGNGLGGLGAFEVISAQPSLSIPYGLLAEDFNNDGNLDLLLTDLGSTEAFTYLGDGNGSFQSRITIDTRLTNPMSAAAGDFNEDGVLDVLIPDRGSLTFGLFYGMTEEQVALTDLDLRSQTKSQVAIEVLDSALETLQENLANIGAIHNRLDSTISSNLLLSESLEEARSKAIDADIAKETSELVRNQILQQAQIAVLAQANTQMSVVLNLLRQ